MSENVHVRAQELSERSLIEGIAAADEKWLEAHLRECADCSRKVVRAQEMIRAFCSVPVSVPRGLAARTQLRVRLRAQEAAQTSNGGALLWIITGASWLLGVLSAPLVWKIFAWAGSQFDVPKLVLELGFVLWWTIPALVAVGVVLHQRGAARGFADRGSL
jgi:hypothetical protein